MMKVVVTLLLACLFISAASTRRAGHVEFVCMKKHLATKTCHYNFKVDGAKYRYVDIGCRFKKTDKVIEKAETGDIALAKDWQIQCAEIKDK